MKHWTIRKQLSVLIAAICLFAVLGEMFLTQWSFRKSFASYVEDVNRPRLEAVANDIAEYYDPNLGWELLASDRRLWRDITFSPTGGPGGGGPMGGNPNPPPRPGGASPLQPTQDLPQEQTESSVSRGILPPGEIPADLRPGPPPAQEGILETPGRTLALVDENRQFIAGNAELLEEAQTVYVPVRMYGDIVGFLVSPGGMSIANELDDAFSQALFEQSVWIGVFVGLMSLLGAVVIAKQFSRPVVRLNEGTDQLMRGNYEYEIPTDGPLEFGLLEKKFNRLAQTLAANRTTQQHWISNISHELRTPLSILQAELDALHTGIRKFGPDKLESLIEETNRLGRLIDDLFLLSKADAGDLSYRMSRVDLKDILENVAEGLLERVQHAGLTLNVLYPKTPVFVAADADRIYQLLANLINNSCAYTAASGEIRVKLSVDKGKALIDVEDSAPGVPAAEQEKIFDRLYRAEKSRTRSLGGSGLGLAICRAIADAHGASVEAFSSDLGGLRIRVTFVGV